ncbi:hypothetical protein CONCODRAFT_3276 [Conidiobolus coronatus NRRL 28638]|uniref:G-protein coupled receptors family 1 profile domain-containing protein n=1 Tax=Conidiobolus coronatus (strain ATCC 28846 / CBS 209.66 / NRRL 28638) TaxID=796925 RepID=A0A137PFD4_CONC2|nr:hypothetical protein CONCODRAFT_3276 [Conidiobolus coronatus NRRL 28638]|eukprot:KXN73716.1 hypothetical protein CONCODRAFT_3276 [Conidiobolus coronatus NRRL 28638]
MSLPVILNQAINPIGMACATAVLLSIIVLAAINKHLANRMTVRLIAIIAFTDLLSHAGEFIAVTNGGLVIGSTSCSVVNGFRLFARTFYCFTNIAICLHLYRAIVLLKKPTWKFEVCCLVLTLGMVLVVFIIYWSLGALRGQVGKNCNPGVDSKTYHMAFLMIQAFINLITTLICIVSTVICRYYLANWINKYSSNHSDPGQSQDQDEFKKARKKMATRSFLYPLSTCITLPFEAIFLIFNACGIMVIELAALMATTTGLAGVLTAVAFSLDPAAHKAFASAYSQLFIQKKGHQSINDSASESTTIIPLEHKLN